MIKLNRTGATLPQIVTSSPNQGIFNFNSIINEKGSEKEWNRRVDAMGRKMNRKLVR